MLESDDRYKRIVLRNVLIFMLVTAGCGWLGLAADRFSGAQSSREGWGMLLWLTGPLLVSLILRGLAGDGWRDLGWRPRFRGNGAWYLFALLLYPALIGLILLLGGAAGAISFPGFASGVPRAFFTALLGALAVNFVKNIFEEFSWRGYLAPRLRLIVRNDIVLHLLTGIIWFSWHLPYWFFFLPEDVFRNYTSDSRVVFVLLGLPALPVAAIAYNELRFLTGSVWPTLLLHTAGNALILTLLTDGYIKPAAPTRLLFTPGMEGGLMMLFFVLIGLRLRRIRLRRDENPSASLSSPAVQEAESS